MTDRLSRQPSIETVQRIDTERSAIMTDVPSLPQIEQAIREDAQVSIGPCGPARDMLLKIYLLLRDHGYVLLPGWQPIETAPKDDVPILGASIYEGAILWCAAMVWSQAFPSHVMGASRVGWYFEGPAVRGESDRGNVATGGFIGDTWPVTHWMPLPNPPGTDARLHGEEREK